MNKRLILFVILVCLAIAIYSWFHGITSKIFIPHEKSTAATVSVQTYLTDKTPFNILLLGYGGGNHDGAYLTDSMMVVRIDPRVQNIFLISVPRDIWIKIPTDGDTGSYWKINAAYTIGMDDTSYPNKDPHFKGTDGGGHLAEYTVSEVLGIPIEYFVGMDFQGFTKTIDTLGGVDITVETAFDDYQYPIEGKENDTCGLTDTQIASLSSALASPSAATTEADAFPCRYEHLHFDKGLQHMDGTTALKYVRSRHSLQDGTDFGRAKRQRNLLIAVKTKVFSVGFIPRSIPFITSLGDDVRTDLSVDDVKTLLANAQLFNTYRVTTLALTDQNFLIDTFSDDGQAILEPKDDLDNWTSVHNWISDELTGKTGPVEAVVQVENGTSIPGLGGVAVNRLRNENIHVLDPIDQQSQKANTTTITVYGNTVNTTDLDTLKKEFWVTAVTAVPARQATYNVLVIVGNDYNLKEGKKVLNEP